MRGSFVRSGAAKGYRWSAVDELNGGRGERWVALSGWHFCCLISGRWWQMPALSLNRFNYTNPHQLNDVEMSLTDVNGVIGTRRMKPRSLEWMKMNSLTSAVSFHHVFELLNRKNYQMDLRSDYYISPQNRMRGKKLMNLIFGPTRLIFAIT